MPQPYLALLRAVNVGGTGKLPMAELTRLCQAAGCENVKTYIQSGNVVFTASPEVAAALPTQLPAPTLLRTLADLQQILAHNPYPPEHSYVVFLFAPLSKPLTAQPPEAFTVAGDHIYLYLPHGVADSKLAVAAGRQGTARNWRTVQKLHDLLASV